MIYLTGWSPILLIILVTVAGNSFVFDIGFEPTDYIMETGCFQSIVFSIVVSDLISQLRREKRVAKKKHLAEVERLNLELEKKAVALEQALGKKPCDWMKQSNSWF